MSWRAGLWRSVPASAFRPTPTRLKLVVLLPLTMGLLVAATGFFAVSMSRRVHMLHGVFSTATTQQLDQLNIQLMLIAVIAAVLAFGIAIGVTMPLRAFADRLEAVKAGDLRTELDQHSTADVQWLAGAFNDALSSVNRYFLQSMTGAVITLDATGHVIGSSPAAEMVLGYREDELVGRRLSEVLAPGGSDRVHLTALETAITRRQPVTTDEAHISTKDGRRIRIGVSVSYLRQADRQGNGKGTGSEPVQHEVVGVTIGFKDLGEIRRLRDNLRKADQLVALGTLTAGVAHELRNPLASMRGLTELMGRDFPLDDPRRRYAATMIESIDRLNKLVENLLMLSVDSTPGGEEVDLAGLVDEVASFVKLGLGARQLDIGVTNDTAGVPAVVRGHRSRLIQALSNIVLNAVQATSDGGKVGIRILADDRQVTIRVHNTGSYIPPEMMKRLFVPFFSTKPAGTGLGLAIARQIITGLDGRIDVESDPAKGTTFILELPAPAGEPSTEAAEERNSALTSMARSA